MLDKCVPVSPYICEVTGIGKTQHGLSKIESGDGRKEIFKTLVRGITTRGQTAKLWEKKASLESQCTDTVCRACRAVKKDQYSKVI